jgi:S1-C subfamily serine protease
MVPTNILLRTFFIKAAQYGTAFALDFEEKQYLITARHLLDETSHQFELQIFHDNKWLRGNANVVGRGEGEIDIAVLQIESRLTPAHFGITPSVGNLMLGQDVYFLGFPFKMWADYGELMAGMPGPFVKKGTLSSITVGHPQVLYVDAINNEGFSGGPLYFFMNGDANQPQIAGIVSKYRVENESVVDGEGNPTALTVPYNTGFLVAYDIKHAIELIKP